MGVKYLGHGPVIGVARNSFNGLGQNVASKVIKDSQGVAHVVKIGAISASITINAGYTTNKNNINNNSSPLSIARLSLGSLTGHQVSSTKIIISFFILGLSLLIVLVIFFVSVSNGIKAISRNPLASQLIIKNTSKVLLYDLSLFVFTILVIYFIVSL